jgi:hypothetical protein
MVGVHFPAESKDFSLLYSIQTSSEAYPASYPVATRALSQGVMHRVQEADHSLLSCADVKNGGAIPTFPITS